MLRIPIWATAFVLVAGASLAAPTLDAAPMPGHRNQAPPLAQADGMSGLLRTVAVEASAGEVQIARKGRGGGGRRGGSRGGHRGGFSAGNNRHVGRVGGPGGLGRGGVHNTNINRNVNVDRNVGVYGGGGGHWDDDDDSGKVAGAALLGGVVGLGVGSMINNSNNSGSQ
jgi:hypothetical protein